MSKISSMFHEKGESKLSMTRVIAAMLAVPCAINIHPAMGWPFAFVCFSVLFAVPFKGLFDGSHGATLLGKFIDKFGVGQSGEAKGAIEAVSAAFHRRDPVEGYEVTR